MQILPRSAAGRAALSLRVAQAPFVCQSCQRSLRQFSASATRRRRAAAPPPPLTGYAQLTSRRLLSIAGYDVPRFLQGIITQSVIPGGAPRNSGRLGHDAVQSNTAATANGFYAGFLNAAGRVLHDVFIYRDTLGLGKGEGDGKASDAFIIEVDAERVGALAKHLKRYRLRSKYKFRVLDEGECAAWQVWDDSSPSSSSCQPQHPSQLSQLKDSIVLPDTRAPGMGFRILAPGGADGLQLDMQRVDEDAYRVRRYLRGVAEGQAEILREQALPLESNMDVAGAIDFRKGCYVGQELTIRTKHRGVVRKRILPCVLYPAGSAATVPQQLEYKPYVDSEEGGEKNEEALLSAEDIPPNLSIERDGAKGRSAGTWLRGVGNIGLALCRLQVMTDVEFPGDTAVGAPFDPAKDEFVVKFGADKEGNRGRSLKVKAFVPEWLRERLRENGASGH
ncbi:ccr4 associated factor [Parahypoxylon ruwenzoriense]